MLSCKRRGKSGREEPIRVARVGCSFVDAFPPDGRCQSLLCLFVSDHPHACHDDVCKWGEEGKAMRSGTVWDRASLPTTPSQIPPPSRPERIRDVHGEPIEGDFCTYVTGKSGHFFSRSKRSEGGRQGRRKCLLHSSIRCQAARRCSLPASAPRIDLNPCRCTFRSSSKNPHIQKEYGTECARKLIVQHYTPAAHMDTSNFPQRTEQQITRGSVACA